MKETVFYGKPKNSEKYNFEEYDYEFEVYEETDEGLKWIDSFEYYTNDVNKLLETNPKYILCHNVRVAHKEKKSVKKSKNRN